jgi:hypothetical protein
MPTLCGDRDTALRRAPWQAPRVSQRSLTPRAAAQGAPLLQAPPPRQAVWGAVIALFQEHVPLDGDTGRASRTRGQGLEATQTTRMTWPIWTRRLAASRAHLAAGQDDTFLPGPTALATRAGRPLCAVWQQQGMCRW